MNFYYIKASGLRRLFIWAGIGLILLGAGCTLKTNEESKPEVESVPANEMISILWNEGWTPAISVAFGIPVELHGSEEITYEIAGDTHYLCLLKDGRPESMDQTGTTRKPEEIIYWNPAFANAQKYLDGIGTSWINIVRKQEGYPTGLVLIRVSPQQVKSPSGEGLFELVFKADIIASVAFPWKDGVYQDISEKDLKELEEGYRKRLLE